MRRRKGGQNIKTILGVEVEVLEIPMGAGKYHIGMSVDLVGAKYTQFIQANCDVLSSFIEEVEKKLGKKNITGYSANITMNGIRKEVR